MKRGIFVTGGAGYIGSHGVQELRKKGYRLGLEGRVDIVSGGVFNGGHNRPVKVLDLVEKIITLSGKKGVRCPPGHPGKGGWLRRDRLPVA
jgi:nucleoside-diphosphate-sugar epimerase